MILAASGAVGGGGFHADLPAWVRIEGDTIVETGTGSAPEGGGGGHDSEVPLLVPGFVDLQVNGVGAIDFAADGDHASALDGITRTGCTTCCPTLVTAPDAAYPAMLDRIAELRTARGSDTRCRVAGVHLEGPFLGGAPGAHPRELIRAVDLVALRAWIDRHAGLVRIVTLAPEADPGFAATQFLAAHGIIVAIGHTAAGDDEIEGAIEAGATLVTHVFNGMPPFHHRAPGPAGVALTDPRVTASIIADGIHVHPMALRLAIAAKRDIALVTDAVATDAGTVGEATFLAGADGAARLADGTLAGSTLTMDAAVRNVVGLGASLDRAVEMAATVPGALLARAGELPIGRLEPGFRADIVALDEGLRVTAVWLAGRRVG